MSTYGIDLGTTYSCIATLDRNGNPEVVRNQADASDTLASAVFFESADNVVIGNSAKDMVETDGERVVQFVKREIGKPNARTYEFDGKTYTPVEISALILGRLKQMVEEQGGSVDDVVITCPAYFGLEERNATKKAGELAGMNVLNLINEPTAAALSYCARQFQEERTILVYDLGGGTFDVTIVKMSLVMNADGNEVQKVTVITTGGNDELGGKDWDDKLFDHILQACCDENGLTPEEIDVETRQLIRSRVETTKKKLSNAETAKVKINVNGAMTTINISREEFENLTSDKVAQTMTYVEDTLQKAGNIEIDTVLLVGGSTFMPMIRNAVEARFPGKVQIEDPDRAVAKGAAICASMLVEEAEGSVPAPIGGGDKPEEGGSTGTTGPQITHAGSGLSTSFVVEDQTPRSFGPGVLNEVGDYIIDNIIKMGEIMPATAVKTYYTAADNMVKIVLRAFENMSQDDSLTPCVDNMGEPQQTDPAHNVKLLGELEMLLPPNTKKGSPIEVTFQVDAVGVYVKAVNLSTGEIVETTLRMESDVDAATSAVNQMSISAE
ncbi:Hsp70 family protein [Aerococcaceae bacterium NML190073]|nr:Hsp70 family protein [Aerococcaceae bacterium NML190073]